MDAVSATIVAGGQARFQYNIEVDINYLISTLIYWIYSIALMAALDWTCARLSATQVVWIHQIHAAGGLGSPTTIVVVIVGCLCSVARSYCNLSYVDKYQIYPKEGSRSVTCWLTLTCTIPTGLQVPMQDSTFLRTCLVLDRSTCQDPSDG